ncbi:MAG: hypothetical protein IIC80_00145 [Chloroflexi bacterium]|nr:hypothetical protein [Chloroflexota bacterium]MCH8284214.1 hypothetical protein [Chloroflexota bacterium]MCI0770133.1 hypothetical protein [Chloroflexota bacterium]
MHDAIAFERAGIPAAVIVEDLFSKAALAKARALGMPDYKPIIVPHPIGGASEAANKGRALTELVVAWLREGPSAEEG